MSSMIDLTDPRYLDEVGWFLYYEKYGRDQFAGTYSGERLAHSRALADAVVRFCGRELQWLEDKTVVTIGCGCTGDLTAWPAALKVAVDPLLATYQRLGMLLEDVPGTSRTIYLSVGVEELPLVDDCADLVLCRNALDHMPAPETALDQIWRVLKEDGFLFLGVDIGGAPTSDEPTVFSVAGLLALVEGWFEVLTESEGQKPYSKNRTGSVRLLARKKQRTASALDKEAILQAYLARLQHVGQSHNP